MMHLQILITLVLASSGLAQGHGPCYRAFTHTPVHERIFLPKNLVKEQRIVADLAIAPIVGDTSLMTRLFADASKERPRLVVWPCASEVPLDRLTIQCAGELLNKQNVAELLSCTAVVPRAFWLEHQSKWKRTGRYVFRLIGPAGENFAVDLREGGCAVVFFPDGTYRCTMDKGYTCVQSLQLGAAPNAASPHR